MNSDQRFCLVAGMLITFVLGSIHSFSVFLVPLEERLSLDRAAVSLLYSFALIFLTLSVVFGYLMYHRLAPAYLVMLTCLVAASGLVLSALSNSWWALFFGYSVLYGAANGVGYGYILQLVGRNIPDRQAFAMAAITAAYAVGSVVFSLGLSRLVQSYGVAHSLAVLGGIVLLVGVIAALLLRRSHAHYRNLTEIKTDTTTSGKGLVFWWLAYGCGVFAGLMAIGHAAGIVQSLDGSYADSVWGAVWIGGGSAAGGFIVGAIISVRSISRILIILPGISAVSLFMLTQAPGYQSAIIVLAVIGFSYGALIAVYPFAVSVSFGASAGPKIYGRIFTAWGFSGLAGPWIAGKLFDFSGNYTLSLAVAAGVAMMSSFFCLITKIGQGVAKS